MEQTEEMSSSSGAMLPGWKNRLYECYVSSGQAQSNQDWIAQSEDNPYFRSRLHPLVPADTETRILDLGCGHGGLIHFLRQQGYSNVAGVDLSPEQVDLAASRGIEGVECDDLLSFLGRQQVPAEVVFLIDVVEHLSRAEMLILLDAVRETMAPEARLILHLPNALGIFGMNVRYGDATHEQAYAKRGIQQCLAACGFELVAVHEDKPIIHGWKSFCRRILWESMTIPFRVLYAAESGCLPGPLSQNMLVVAKAKSIADSQPKVAA